MMTSPATPAGSPGSLVLDILWVHGVPFEGVVHVPRCAPLGHYGVPCLPPDAQASDGLVARLRGEGFEVWYEGLGNWDEAFDEWPWSTDAVLYAAR